MSAIALIGARPNEIPFCALNEAYIETLCPLTVDDDDDDDDNDNDELQILTTQKDTHSLVPGKLSSKHVDCRSRNVQHLSEPRQPI